MTRLITLTLAFGMTMAALVLAQSSRSIDAQFKAAQHAEEVEGDLRKAIEHYRQIANAGDRAAAARALLRMAECLQKLGDVEAKKIYEQIVVEYGDQRDAVVVAGTRLSISGARNVSTTQRRLWVGYPTGAGGSVSPDGRLLSYVDWNTDMGDLALYDFASGKSRHLTNKDSDSDDYAEATVISKDGRQVAYSWFDAKADRHVIRMIALTASGFPKPKQVFDNADISWLAPHDWSSDGRLLAVSLSRVDRSSQIGLIEVESGKLQPLKSVDWRGITHMFFSPDGKYVAFDLPSGDRAGDDTDVVLMAVDGSRESRVVATPARETPMGWAPDGKRLLFASNRSGTDGLWAQRIENGKASGMPELLKSEIGHRSLGITTSGSLFLDVDVGDLDIHLASVDFATGKLTSPASRPVHTYVGANRGWLWSRDGREIAYVSQRDQRGRNSTLVVRSITTGAVRELRPQLGTFYMVDWSPDGGSFVAQGTDLKGRRGLYRIDAQTADTTAVAISEPDAFFASPRFSADGQRLHYAIRKRAEVTFVERDLSSGTERDVIRRKSLANIVLSPDGKLIATRENPDQQSSVVLLVPVAGGEPRELMRVKHPQFIQGVQGWSPNGREVIVTVMTAEDVEVKDTRLVSIEDGASRPLEAPGFRFGGIQVSPDGRQMAYLAGRNAAEVWVLENFLPK